MKKIIGCGVLLFIIGEITVRSWNANSKKLLLWTPEYLEALIMYTPILRQHPQAIQTPVQPSRDYLLDSQLDFALKPNVRVKMSYPGHREYDTEIVTAELGGVGYREDEQKDALSLTRSSREIFWNFGDSLTLGNGVTFRQTYAGRLNTEKLSSFNFGTPSATVFQIWNMFLHHFDHAKEQPHAVTLAISWGSCLKTHSSYFTSKRWTDYQPYIADRLLFRLLDSVEHRLLRKSQLYLLLNERSLEVYNQYVPKNDFLKPEFPVPEGVVYQQDGLIDLDLFSYNAIDSFLSLFKHLPFESYPNTKFYLLLLPNKEMVLNAKLNPSQRDAITKPADLLKKTLLNRQVTILDFFDDMVTDQNFWFIKSGVHLNEYGHAQVAARISDDWSLIRAKYL